MGNESRVRNYELEFMDNFAGLSTQGISGFSNELKTAFDALSADRQMEVVLALEMYFNFQFTFIANADAAVAMLENSGNALVKLVQGAVTDENRRKDIWREYIEDLTSRPVEDGGYVYRYRDNT